MTELTPIVFFWHINSSQLSGWIKFNYIFHLRVLLLDKNFPTKWVEEKNYFFVEIEVYILLWPYYMNHIGGVMVNVFALSVVDCGLGSQSGQTNILKIGICCFSAKHAALRRKSKDWLAQNHDNVYEWCNMSTCRLLFQWLSTIKIQLNMYV
jgi:hypothetical protein